MGDIFEHFFLNTGGNESYEFLTLPIKCGEILVQNPRKWDLLYLTPSLVSFYGSFDSSLFLIVLLLLWIFYRLLLHSSPSRGVWVRPMGEENGS